MSKTVRYMQDTPRCMQNTGMPVCADAHTNKNIHTLFWALLIEYARRCSLCVYIRASSHSQLHLTGGFRVGVTTGRGLMLAHTWSVPQPWRASMDTLIGHTRVKDTLIGHTNRTHLARVKDTLIVHARDNTLILMKKKNIRMPETWRMCWRMER
jgi:hypothetical protein